MTDLDQTGKSSVFARIWQSLFATVVGALLIWAWTSIENMHQDIARIEERLLHIRDKQATFERDINTGTDDRYRGRDADRDFKIRDEKIRDLKNRVRELEKRIYGFPGSREPNP